MKKLLFAIAMCVAFLGCKKDKGNQVLPHVTISFEQHLVSSNSMVRSEGTNELLDIIESKTPEYVEVTLTNTDLGKTYSCKSTESITIPVGNYEITAKSSSCNCESYYETGRIHPHTLLSMTKTAINVTKSTSVITLNLFYNCYAVFALIDECEKCSVVNYDEAQFPKAGKYHYAFFKYDGVKIRLSPYADSADFVVTDIKFVTTYDTSNVYAEFGKYYVIHPQRVDKTSGTFQVNLPDMVEGEL